MARYMVTVKYNGYPIDPENRGGGICIYDGYRSRDAAFEADRAEKGKHSSQRVEIDRMVGGHWRVLLGSARERFLAARKRRYSQGES